jgi:hypothetical protein
LKKFGEQEIPAQVSKEVIKEENLESLDDMNVDMSTVLKKNRPVKAKPTEKNEDSVLAIGRGREEMGEYIDFFQKLFAETQIDNVEEILEAFDNVEQENESLYQQIIRVTEENESLERDISGEQQLLLDLRELSPSELERLEKVEALEEEMGKKQELLEGYEAKLGGISRNIMSFQVLSIDSQKGLPPILDLLGIDSETRMSDSPDKFYISEKNLPHLTELLTKMESKVNNLIEAENFHGPPLSNGQENRVGVVSDSRSLKKVASAQGDVQTSDETLKKLTGIAQKCNLRLTSAFE